MMTPIDVRPCPCIIQVWYGSACKILLLYVYCKEMMTLRYLVYIIFNVCVAIQISIPEEMHENVVSISHIPEWLLWSFQNNSQNSDKPSTRHPSKITTHIINLTEIYDFLSSCHQKNDFIFINFIHTQLTVHCMFSFWHTNKLCQNFKTFTRSLENN